jgi:hypothetical protein
MWRPSPLPSSGEVFLDARGDGRGMRVSWHPEADVVVLSLWRGGTCSGTFRLRIDEVPQLIDVLRGGLQTSYHRYRGLLESVFDEDADDLHELDGAPAADDDTLRLA